MKLSIKAHFQNRHGSEAYISGGYTFTHYGSVPSDDIIKSILCDCNGLEPQDWEMVELEIYNPDEDESDD